MESEVVRRVRLGKGELERRGMAAVQSVVKRERERESFEGVSRWS